MVAKYDVDELLGMIADGMSTMDMADHFGVTENAVRNALKNRDIRAPNLRKFNRSIRARVNTMKPLDAVEYLLGCLENLSGAMCDPNLEHQSTEAIPGLTAGQRRLMILLWDAGGRTVSHKQLYDAYCFGIVGDDPGPKIVDVQICKVRKILPDGIRIDNVFGVGYRLVRH